MKAIYGILLFLSLNLPAQEGARSLGMIKVHDQGNLGFHGNLVNDGVFNDNQGLVGFYSDRSIMISGLFPTIFNDTEFITEQGLQLVVSMKVENNANFVQGDILTPRTDSFTSLQFLSESFYTGANNMSKVDGYASIQNKQQFTFPVGDAQQLRALALHSESVNPVAHCAYFFLNPDDFPSFNSLNRENTLQQISRHEFWRLEGSVPSTIQISWNERSQMASMAKNVDEIVVVGWSKANNQWENLGAGSIGNLSDGFALSSPFVPDDYEALTFGIVDITTEIPDLANYLLTPNGDGINDFLHIDELALSNNNWLRIYDRNGMLVFEKYNYTNEFRGYANKGDVVLNRSNGLPQGVYFYLVMMEDLGLEYQGYLYLDR